MGDLTRMDGDEEPFPRSHSGCFQEAREVFHMESDVDDELPLSHAARSSALPPTSHDVPTTEVDPSSRANRCSPLSAEIDHEPLLLAVGTAPSRRLWSELDATTSHDKAQGIPNWRVPLRASWQTECPLLTRCQKIWKNLQW